MPEPQLFSKRFFIRRSQLSTNKMFVEFHEPDYRLLLNALQHGAYPAKPLKELSQRIFSGPFGSDRKVDMYQDSGIPYLRVKDVLADGIVREGLMYISDEKHKDLARSRVLPGMVLITIAGRLGTAAVFPDDLNEGNITGHIVGIELKAEINPHYVAYAINSQFGAFQVQRLGHRTTRPELNNKEVGRILIPLPPREVQDRIAQIMQDAYAQRQRMLAEADSQLARMSRLVLELLGVHYQPISLVNRIFVNASALRSGRFDADAVIADHIFSSRLKLGVPLSSVIKRIEERVNPSTECPDEDVNYIGLANIGSQTGELTNFAPVKGSDVLSSSVKFQKGDILFGRMRPYLNKVWLAEFDGICTGEAVVMRLDPERVDAHFLQALLLSPIMLDQVVPFQSGTSLPRVTHDRILRAKLPVPDDVSKQREIGQQLAFQRDKSNKLRAEANRIVAAAKAQVERMILGEEADA